MSISFSEVADVAKTQDPIYVIGTVIHAVPNVQESLPAKFNQIKWCVPTKFERYADRIRHFNIRKDDVWVLGYFKSGTTWMQNIVWQLKNNFNFTASAVKYSDNLLELPIYNSASTDTQFDVLDATPSPRIIKSHLPVYLLPKELWTVRPKIIYVARNPKDVAVSSGHFINALGQTNLPLESIFDSYLDETALLGPFHAHVLSFWELRNDLILFIRYEDLLADQYKSMRKIAEYLENSASHQEILGLVEHVSFNNMKSKIDMVTLDGDKITDTAGYRFCRKGQASSYRDDMSDEYIKRFDEWTSDRLKGSDFTYENV